MRGIWLWMLERYPPGIIIVHALAYMTSVAVVQGLVSETIVFSYLREGLGILIFFMFPLILRIMDEHKDYESDCVLHPERVLQRGDT
ncbi:MAG: prenyltransferase, partial [Deltaproteobacteria bacterium]|nr:prenyltransferase [Deltaproteobacteria bacterium]